LSTALPARSSPLGSSRAATTARVREEPVKARVPSIAETMITAAREKLLPESSARAPKAAASPQ